MQFEQKGRGCSWGCALHCAKTWLSVFVWKTLLDFMFLARAHEGIRSRISQQQQQQQEQEHEHSERLQNRRRKNQRERSVAFTNDTQ